jgi:hypothetical protein
MRRLERLANIRVGGLRLCARLASAVSRMLAISLLATLAVDVAGAQAPNPNAACAALANLTLPQTTITSAMIVPAGPFSQVSIGDPYASEATTSPAPTCSSNIASPQLPAFCRVTAGIATPGAAEPINIEVWLPLQNWNGKFVGIGNHGFAGEIEYADMGPHLVRGYAVATTDTGHAGANATLWMQNAQQIINYGYLGVHEMTVKAKAIIKAATAGHPDIPTSMAARPAARNRSPRSSAIRRTTTASISPVLRTWLKSTTAHNMYGMGRRLSAMPLPRLAHCKLHWSTPRRS